MISKIPAPQIQSVPAADVYAWLASSPDGLTPSQVEHRRHEVGPNRLATADPLRWVRVLVRHLTGFFTLLLVAAGVLCFVADAVEPDGGMTVLGWALLVVSLLNALFAFAQEYRAEKAMEMLARFLPHEVLVRRAGQDVRIPADELVPGDVLIVADGDRIAADARLVAVVDLIVNNAPLTGEAEPSALVADAVTEPPPFARNIVHAGCTVLRGRGEAVVFATGQRTEFGRIAHLSQTVHRAPSPLEAATSQMIRVLTLIAVVMGVAFFIYGVATGRSVWVNLVFMMGIIVANVPEGLLPTFTLALAMGSLRMARRNVLVRRLSAVEALGAVHVICTDKTGTLTENRQSLARVVGPTGDDPLDPAAEARVLAAAYHASEVRHVADDFAGDALDVAIARRFRDQVGPPPETRVIHRWGFDLQRRRAGVVHDPIAPRYAVKGAWEALRPMFAAELDRARADATVVRLAAQGLRVLAVAERLLPPGTDPTDDAAVERELTLLGFLCVVDPLRPEVPAAVAACHGAGIDVIMITGDHPDTALAIASEAGITTTEAITGQQLAAMSQRALMAALTAGVRVFARATPEHKLLIIAALQGMDRVVAMTGDGVNDAPALKAADVGVAMGRSGTDVAREAAQIVLLDDNFASIVAGVEEGRTVFANIRKFTSYVLVSNGPEIVPYLLFIVFPVPLALSIIHILCIDLGTDIVPSMALGQEPPDPDDMKRPPRPRREGLLDGGLVVHSYLFLGVIEAAWSMMLFFVVLVQAGWTWGEIPPADDPAYRGAVGIALASILLMQIGNLIGRRYRLRSGLDRGLFQNRLMLVGIAIQIVFSWAVLYAEPVQDALGTGPVSLGIYALAWLGVPLIFGLDWLRKRVSSRRAARR